MPVFRLSSVTTSLILVTDDDWSFLMLRPRGALRPPSGVLTLAILRSLSRQGKASRN